MPDDVDVRQYTCSQWGGRGTRCSGIGVQEEAWGELTEEAAVGLALRSWSLPAEGGGRDPLS